MKSCGNLTKFAAIGLTLVAIGLGVQYLNARANAEATGATSAQISTIAPLEMMGSVGPLPITVIDNYI